MLLNIAELFERTIAPKYHLPRQDRDWLYENGEQIQIRAPNNQSLAFSLDPKKVPFPFICGSPPPKVTKMCDVIICSTSKQRHYIFIVEKKREWKEDYHLQLINGKLFCDWMLALFREHGHLQGKVTFVGLLLMYPMLPSVRASTTPATESELIQGNLRLQAYFDNKCYRIVNQTIIHLKKYM